MDKTGVYLVNGYHTAGRFLLMKRRLMGLFGMVMIFLLAACESLPILEPTIEATVTLASDYEPGDIAVTLPPAWTATATIRSTITATSTITPTASSTAYPTWQPCEDAPSSQLQVGIEAEVGTTLGLPKEVYDKPGRQFGIVVGTMNPGEDLEILGGPSCAEQLVWWEVDSLERDLEGWMPEGDAEAFWIVPSQ